MVQDNGFFKIQYEDHISRTTEKNGEYKLAKTVLFRSTASVLKSAKEKSIFIFFWDRMNLDFRNLSSSLIR